MTQGLGSIPGATVPKMCIVYCSGRDDEEDGVGQLSRSSLSGCGDLSTLLTVMADRADLASPVRGRGAKGGGMPLLTPGARSERTRLPMPNAILLSDPAERPAAPRPDLAVLRNPVRLQALASYGGAETSVPLGFDDVAHLAARLCGTSAAIVSLFSAEQQMVKARVGTEVSQLPVNQTACAYALSEAGVLTIPDLSLDARTAHFPFVAGAPHMRFYAGTPLVASNGHALGTICVLDPVARPGGLSGQQQSDLMALARQVMAQLDQHRIDVQLRQVLAERDALIAEAAEEAARQSALLALGDAQREAGDVVDLVRVAARTLCETLDLSRAGYGIASPDGAEVEIVADWCAAEVPSFVGTYRLAEFGEIAAHLGQGEVILVDDVVTDPRTAGCASAYTRLGIHTMVLVPILKAGRLKAVFCLHDLEPRAWSEPMLRFIKNVTDRTAASVTRAQAEEEQALLNREIGHRMKNMLAMVQAIAVQTLRGASDTASASQTLMARIQALASAHDLLLGGHAAASDLGRLAESVLGVHVGPAAGRLRLQGPQVEVSSQLALSLALILHELGTNATKYGAWSTNVGEVDLTWSLTGSQNLVLTWREGGGPAVVPPVRRGFGSRLIDRGLFGTGAVTLDFAPEGVVCEIAATL